MDTLASAESVYWALDGGIHHVPCGHRMALVARPPDATEETGLDRLLELVVRPGLGGVGTHERQRPLVHRPLNRLQHGGDRAGEPFLRRERLARLPRRIAPRQDHRALLDVARADLD